MTDLKKIVLELIQNGQVSGSFHEENPHLMKSLYKDAGNHSLIRNHEHENDNNPDDNHQIIDSYEEDTTDYIEESLSIQKKEKDLIIRALQKHNGRRKKAAEELGISERTLYRKIKEYDINA